MAEKLAALASPCNAASAGEAGGGRAEMRREIVARGRSHFRTVADDQYAMNEVLQTKYFDRLRILPSQYNFRPHLNFKQRGWPSVSHLHGILIYHNATCMDAVKQLGAVQAKASRRFEVIGGAPGTRRPRGPRRPSNSRRAARAARR